MRLISVDNFDPLLQAVSIVRRKRRILHTLESKTFNHETPVERAQKEAFFVKNAVFLAENGTKLVVFIIDYQGTIKM
jgi:hypothetical protein